ncbi:hypothetical protein VNI00_012169 [Paramarasmius palmivorus]|uniref:Uncharacterized protein n=1 Tax=Paramarasmius palmivorus TaxID=297713 RepID=A0AAW0C832_9AGAR
MAFQIPAFDPNSTVGALEVGALAAVFLFGVVTLQVYIYYHQFPEDSWYIKTLVAFVWILELGHSIALCHYLYTVSVTQYGKPLLLLIPPKSVDIAILIGGFLGPIEQGWFIRRLYVFSKNMFLTSISTLLSLTRFTGTCALAGIAFGMGPINEFIEDWRWLILLVLIVGAMTDLLLATTLWYYLMQWRQRSDKK